MLMLLLLLLLLLLMFHQTAFDVAAFSLSHWRRLASRSAEISTEAPIAERVVVILARERDICFLCILLLLLNFDLVCGVAFAVVLFVVLV